MMEYMHGAATELPKIDLTLSSPSKFSPQKRIKIQCQNQFHTPKAQHTEPAESKNSPGGSLSRKPKPEAFQLESKGNQSFTKKLEFEQWKKSELQKYQECRRVSDFSNEKLAEDKRSSKVSLNPISNKSSVGKIDLEKSREMISQSPKRLDSLDGKGRKESGPMTSFPSELHLQEKSIGMSFDTISNATIRSNLNLDNAFEKIILDSRSPNHSGESGARKEILALAQWLDQLLRKVKGDKTLDSLDSFSKTQEVYSLGMSEITNLISMDSSEKGVLLKSIWNAHINLMNECLSHYVKENANNYNKFLAEIDKIKSAYSKYFETLNKDNTDKGLVIEKLEQRIEKLNQQTSHLYEKEGQHRKVIDGLSTSVRELNQVFEGIFEEKTLMQTRDEASPKKKQRFEDILAKSYSQRDIILQKVEKILGKEVKNPVNSSVETRKEKHSISLFTSKADESFEMQDVCVDTFDLTKSAAKETQTSVESKSFRDNAVQTVYYDEIHEEEDGPAGVNPAEFVVDYSLETAKGGKMTENQLILRPTKKVGIEKIQNRHAYTLTKACEWYSTEVTAFFGFLREMGYMVGTEEFAEFDWRKFLEGLKNVEVVHEQFIKNIKHKDSVQSNETLLAKLEVFELKMEMTEAEKIKETLKKNYEDFRKKFEEFYKTCIRIQSSEDEDPSLNFGTGSLSSPMLRGKSLLLLEREEPKDLLFAETPMKSSERIEKSPKVMKAKKKNSLMIVEEEKEIIEKAAQKDKTKLPKIQPLKRSASLKKSQTIKYSETNEQKELEIAKFDSSDLLESLEIKVAPDITLSLKKGDSAEEGRDNVNPPSPTSQVKAEYTRRRFSLNPQIVDSPNERLAEAKRALELIGKQTQEMDDMKQKRFKEKRKSTDETLSDEKSNMNELITQANKILPRKKIWDRVNSPNTEKCYDLLQKIEATEITPSKTLPLPTLLKTFSQILTELVKLKILKQGNLNPLFFILYDFLMPKYRNNHKNVEAKILEIFQACLAYSNLPKIRNFARLIGAPIEGREKLFDGNDLEFYLRYFILLDDHPISNPPGISLAMSLQESTCTGLVKVLDVCQTFLGNYPGGLDKTKQDALIGEVKAAKQEDPIIVRKFVVDVDLVLESFLEFRQTAEMIYKPVFRAVDVDSNEALNINEFIFLLRNFERGKFEDKDILEMFKREYDFFDQENQEKCMSFKRFAFLCNRDKIITPKKQEEFLQTFTDTLDEIKDLAHLKEDWEIKKNLIKLKLFKTNSFNPFYINVIKSLEKIIKGRNCSKEEESMIWIRYRIMDEESNNFVRQMETDAFLPNELNTILNKINKIERD